MAVGPDGSVYVADTGNNRVRRIALDGTIRTVAGDGVRAFAGDEGPAVDAEFDAIQGITVGADGSIFLATGPRIRRIGPEGIVSTIAGNGTTAFSGDGGPALNAGINFPQGIAVGPDGSVYFSDVNQHRVRRIAPDGIISTVAGNGSFGFSGDGGPATSASLALASGIVLAPDGSLFIAEQGNHRIRRVGANGIINTIAGNGQWEWDYGDGNPAVATAMGYPKDIALAPDGSILIADIYNHVIRQLTPVLPGASASDQLIPSDDGRELYVFNGAGKHLRTLDALTGAVRFEFGYDGQGHLASVTDVAGNVTTIERAGGLATAIVAPGGQRSPLVVDADQFLDSIENPAGESYVLSYAGGGLLQSLRDPAGHQHIFGYDGAGRLASDSRPDGGGTTLARTELANGYSVTTTTELGRTQTYTLEQLATKQIRRTTKDANSATTVTIITAGSVEQTTYPNGGTVTVTYGPDGRFGMMAPVTTKLVVTTPGGATHTMTASRSVSLNNPADLLSLYQMYETVNDAGNVTTRVYDAATRTFTLTTREGRTAKATLDARGRTVSYQPGPGVAPITETYDARGRILGEGQGALSQTYGYDTLNRTTSSTNAAGNITTYAYDLADRMTDATTPGGHHYSFAHDANGNVTTVTMPSSAVHTFGYDAIDQQNAYTPPDGAGTAANAYSADREWTETSLASGRELDATYDSGGRPAGRSYAEASVAFAYGDLTDRASSMSRTPSSGPAQTTTMTWDADLPKSMTSSGAAAGQYTFGYDSRMLLASMGLSSGADTANIAVTRDRDGLVTGYGPFSVAHNGPAGAVSAITNAQVNVTQAYDTLGRLTQRRHQVAGATIYQLDLSYNSAGKISQRTETTSAGSETRVYTYDADGQLTQVTTGGSTIETYSYDANGNRTVPSATYDAQDRPSNLNGVAYVFDADGYLFSRGADTFQYTTRGELASASAGGQAVTYGYDALGRRVSRTDAGAQHSTSMATLAMRSR